MLNGNGARRRRNISRSEDRRRIRSKIWRVLPSGI
jgi:hypothetical protein